MVRLYMKDSKMYKKTFITLVTILCVLMLVIAGFNYAIDPYFHYRYPNKNLAYPIEYQRYQNDGIVKNFEYDAIIAGTSMAENFKTSEFDELFGVNSIKVVNSGARFKEINELLETAFENNKNIKYVIRSLDYSMLNVDKDNTKYDKDEYPSYLYNDNVFDDIKYLLNKGTLFSSLSVILNTILGNKTTTFDEYSNWMKDAEFGLDNIWYDKSVDYSKDINHIDSEDIERVIGNLSQNIVDIAKQNKNCEFYLYFPPYSVLYYGSLKQEGNLEEHMEIEKVVIEELLKYDNIHLFSFTDSFDITCNLDNYKDAGHYGESVNSYILCAMNTGEHELTKDNYIEYLEKIEYFYNNYDYLAIFD